MGGVATAAPGAEVVEVPAADPEWHPIALGWFESLSESGQSAFYEPSDWATAVWLAESMSRELKPQPVVTETGVSYVSYPPKAATVAAWLKGGAALLATEADRRRLRLELQRPGPDGEEVGGVTNLDEFTRRLRGAPTAG